MEAAEHGRLQNYSDIAEKYPCSFQSFIKQMKLSQLHSTLSIFRNKRGIHKIVDMFSTDIQENINAKRLQISANEMKVYELDSIYT